MAYPSPYRAGMSSLGYQWILHRLRTRGVAAERIFLPDDPDAWRKARAQPVTMETHAPLHAFPLIAVSLAYELELAGLVQLLQLAGVPPLRRDRGPNDPRVLIGGPLTFSNPLPAAPFADAMLLGEADDTAPDAVEAFFDTHDRQDWLDQIAGMPGGYVPERHGTSLPAIATASDTVLPAYSAIRSPEAELSDMFLIEGERGCHRQCTFCVMRRGDGLGMRRVDPATIVNHVPEGARKVGLVGAAISDHPRLVDLLQALVDRGLQVSLSSLRADRIARKPGIATQLRRSGARTLTVASDAASQRLRKQIAKGTSEAHLLACAEQARQHRFDVLKIYMMVGVPDETDEDIDELIRFSTELSRRTRVALGVAPFVAKRNTPLDGEPYAGIRVVDRRLRRLQRGLRGRVQVRPTSARWAWVEYQLAQGGPAAGEALYRAVSTGGRYADMRRELGAMEPCDMRPWAQEPTVDLSP